MFEILSETQLAIPLLQVVLLLTLTTLALLFGQIKFALLVNYCFTLYWGYLSNTALYSDTGAFVLDSFSISYFGFGFLILILATVGFLTYQ
ncbi:MAG: hypothetical protein PHY31_08415 [Smithellaceae bacterium]|nr:hypothetical protein [Smithellaceae bacterium]